MRETGTSHAADSPIETEFVWTLRNVGIDHVLLGSDYPQLTLAKTLDALERLGLDENEKAKIRYANAHRLLKKWMGADPQRASPSLPGAMLATSTGRATVLRADSSTSRSRSARGSPGRRVVVAHPNPNARTDPMIRRVTL